jgi:Epoxide hydrolase N terminus
MKKIKSLLAATTTIVALIMQSTIGNTQTKTNHMSDESIRPFKVHVPQEQLADLKRRILATKWPEKELVNDETQGVQFATMKALAHYWATDYDWRKVEARLNALPQFITTIDGVDIHFIHVRSKQKNALPVIITHGWPGIWRKSRRCF